MTNQADSNQDSGARVLLVDDDFELRMLVTELLRREGYQVDTAASAEEADFRIRERPVDLVILDWTLPGVSGLELLETWRERQLVVPVIMLTSNAALDDRVEGLTVGADDYLTKPFSPDELIARVRARLRSFGPTPARQPQRLELSDRVADLRSRRIQLGDGQELPLTDLEARTLEHLVSRAGQAVSRRELLETVWGYGEAAKQRTRAVDNTIYRLRGKIEALPDRPRHLFRVHGVGYRFEP